MFSFLRKSKGRSAVPALSASAFLERDADAVVIDVRTPGEFSGGHITGARNIDVQSGAFQQEVASLDTSRTYILYCRSGNRSDTAARMMAEEGFRVYNAGGIGDLEKAGASITR